MVDIFKRLNLGFRHVQYILLAVLISLDHWTVTPIISSYVGLSEIRADNQTQDVAQVFGSQSPTQIKTVSFIFFAIGRVLSAFITLKIKNKYFLVTVVMFIICFVCILGLFPTNLSYLSLLAVICLYQFMRAWIWPLTINILTKWMPPHEVTLANALLVIPREIFSILFIFSMKKATREQFHSIFSTSVAFYCLWIIVFILLGADSPSTAYFLPTEELHYLSRVIGPRKKVRCSAKIPFKAILTTGIYYGWLLADFGRECMVVSMIFGLSYILTEQQIANIYGLQALSMAFYLGVFVACWYSDRLILRSKATPSQVRKVFSSVGTCGTAMAMILTAYSNQATVTRTVFFVVALVFSCILALGQPVAIIDLSPNYASVTFSMLSFVRLSMFTAKGFIDKQFGLHLQNEESFIKRFYVYSFVGYLGNMIFLICGEIKTQSFDNYDTYSWKSESVTSLQ